MKQFLSLFIIICVSAFGQETKEMQPILGFLVDKSRKGEIEYLNQKARCDEFWQTHQTAFDESKLSTSEKKMLELCEEETLSYWDVLGAGCSWYCGGGIDTNSATSALDSANGINYSANNIHDLNYKTAWIEGVPGYGVGERITYHFPPQNPRITDIIVVNGYIKSKQAWKDNSRVKKLKMYVNNEFYAILNLEDSRQEQAFKFEPLGYIERSNLEVLETQPWWSIEFEILEVYKGDKYDDTAITEIYFDGIDVH